MHRLKSVVSHCSHIAHALYSVLTLPSTPLPGLFFAAAGALLRYSQTFVHIIIVIVIFSRPRLQLIILLALLRYINALNQMLKEE